MLIQHLVSRFASASFVSALCRASAAVLFKVGGHFRVERAKSLNPRELRLKLPSGLSGTRTQPDRNLRSREPEKCPSPPPTGSCVSNRWPPLAEGSPHVHWAPRVLGLWEEAEAFFGFRPFRVYQLGGFSASERTLCFQGLALLDALHPLEGLAGGFVIFGGEKHLADHSAFPIANQKVLQFKSRPCYGRFHTQGADRRPFQKKAVDETKDEERIYCGHIGTMRHRAFQHTGTEHLRQGQMWDAAGNMFFVTHAWRLYSPEPSEREAFWKALDALDSPESAHLERAQLTSLAVLAWL